MQSLIDAINALIAGLSGGVTTLLLALAGISILTVAIVDIIKPWIRPIFVKKHFIDWFEPPEENVSLSLLIKPKIKELGLHYSIICEFLLHRKGPEQNELNLLLKRVFGLNFKYFYKLKLDVLFSQLNIAVYSILDYPDTDSMSLLKSLSGYNDSTSTDTNKDRHLQDINNIIDGRVKVNDDDKYFASQTRLERQIGGNMTIFKNYLEYRWARNLHILSFIINLIFIFGSAMLYETNLGCWTLLYISIIGAFFAPVAHNLVVAIKGAKDSKAN